MKSSAPSKDDLIVAQSWAWRGSDGTLVLDSIESQIDFRRKHEVKLNDFYAKLGDTLIKEIDIPRVYVGAGAGTTTPKTLATFAPITNAYPIGHPGYPDSASQRILASRDLPMIMQSYLDSNPTSKLKNMQHEPSSLSSKNIVDWLDLLALDRITGNSTRNNAAKQSNHYLGPEYLPKKVNGRSVRRIINNRKAMIQEWFDLFRDPLNASFNWGNVEKFIAEKGNSLINFPIDVKNNTALLRAAFSSEWALVKKLLANGADPNITNIDNQSVLDYAVHAGRLDIVKEVIEKLDPHSSLILRTLEQALQTGKEDIAIELLRSNNTALNNIHRGENTLTFLLNIVNTGNCQLIRLLAEKGINLNIQDLHLSENTLLHPAASMGKLDIVKWLVDEKGFNVNATNISDETPLASAVDTRKWDIVKYFIDEKGLDFKGIDFFSEDLNEYTTILNHAAVRGDLDMVKWLIDFKGCDPSGDYLAETALFYAIKGHNLNIVKYLVNEKGINPDEDELDDLLEYAEKIGVKDIEEWLREKIAPEVSASNLSF